MHDSSKPIQLPPKRGRTKPTVTPAEAAARLGVSPQAVRVGLQNGTLPFGGAIRTPSGRYTYYIMPQRLEQYCNGGTLASQQQPQADVVQLSDATLTALRLVISQSVTEALRHAHIKQSVKF